ncbi:MAG: hypothetical protein JSV03_00745, partial [Planctomycetota bacterium]
MMQKYKLSSGNRVTHNTCMLIGIAVIWLSGCARQHLMETPTIVSLGGIDPFQKVPANRQTAAVPVFVASGRTVSGLKDPAKFYTNDRSRV